MHYLVPEKKKLDMSKIMNILKNYWLFMESNQFSVHRLQ